LLILNKDNINLLLWFTSEFIFSEKYQSPGGPDALTGCFSNRYARSFFLIFILSMNEILFNNANNSFNV